MAVMLYAAFHIWRQLSLSALLLRRCSVLRAWLYGAQSGLREASHYLRLLLRVLLVLLPLAILYLAYLAILANFAVDESLYLTLRFLVDGLVAIVASGWTLFQTIAFMLSYQRREGLEPQPVAPASLPSVSVPTGPILLERAPVVRGRSPRDPRPLRFDNIMRFTRPPDPVKDDDTHGED